MSRRSHSLVRLRALLGFSVGSVNELTLRQFRFLRAILTVMLFTFALGAVAVAMPATFLWRGYFAPTHTTTLKVVKVLEPFTWEPVDMPYAVRANDGVDYDFRDDPQLAVGDTFQVTRDGRGAYLGATVRGRYIGASRPTAPVVTLLVPLVFLPLLAFAFYLWLAAHRAASAIARDLKEGPVQITGIYVGSWHSTQHVWRASLGAAYPFANGFGFPVAIRLDSGEEKVLAAPASRLPDVKAFEERIKNGSRRVQVTYYAHTGAIEGIAAEDGATLDLRSPVRTWTMLPAGIPLS